MPRYGFTIRNSDRFDDEEGVLLPDDLAARTHAIGIIQELEKASETDWAGHTMEVTRDGRLVWKIPFEMAWIDRRQRKRSS
jgi:hypothetical protein